MKKLVILALCVFMSAFSAVQVMAAGSYVDVNGNTVVTDVANGFGFGGMVTLNDCTKQNTGVSGIALGQNAQGAGTFDQIAVTDLTKTSGSLWGSATGEVVKSSYQLADMKVASPIGMAGGNLEQTNSGCLLTAAGPNSTLTVSKDSITQNMSGGGLGNFGLDLTQTAYRSTEWNALSVGPKGFTQNVGLTEALAVQGKALGPCIGCAQGSDCVKINTSTATGYIALPGYTAANGTMSANLAANASGNVPTTVMGKADLGYMTVVSNGPTTINQSGTISASVQVTK
jgi:hypothetical protein